MKSKLHSVHIRVYIPRQSRRYYPVKLPLKVSRDQWSGKDGAWISNTHPFAFEINSKIAELKNKIHELTKRFYLQNKTVSFGVSAADDSDAHRAASSDTNDGLIAGLAPEKRHRYLLKYIQCDQRVIAVLFQNKPEPVKSNLNTKANIRELSRNLKS